MVSAPIGIDADWWRQATVYQIYPRSFCDLNGDGIGDLKGITSKTQYLKDLGVDAVWLSPHYPSPLNDGGYDVADYRDVDPRIGTLDEFDEMTKSLNSAGIKVIIDIVPNHCSSDHEWFQAALAAKPGSPERARFIFREGKGPDGSEPPNDWICCFGGSAWDRVPDGQWYLHLFDTSQPDFDWDHPDVQADFLKTLKFWGNRGVSGFRVDVAHGCVKDMSEPHNNQKEITEIADKMHRGETDSNAHPFWDRDGVLEAFKDWRKVFNSFSPPLTAVAEAWVAPGRKHLYASSEGLGQAFSFDMLMCPYNAAKYKEIIENSLKFAKESGSSTTWVYSNHDVVRHATRYGIAESTTAEGREAYHAYNANHLLSGGKEPKCDLALGLKRAKAATLMMLALPGSAYLYQGEELGLPEVVEMPAEKRQDPTFHRHKGKEIGRDGCRVPLPWSTSPPSYGFSPEGSQTEPHLPPPSWWGEYAADEEAKDDKSTLKFYQKALGYRRKLQGAEELEMLPAPEGVLHFKRPGGWEVLFNVSNKEGVEVPKGEVLVASADLDGGKVGVDTAVWVKV